MISDVLLYIGAAVVLIWGIAHNAATKPVVCGFGDLSDENRRIITMEWVAEGLALCFIGLLVLLVTAFGSSDSTEAIVVYITSGVILIAMAGWTFAIGFKTSIIPIKICPLVLTTVAVLFFIGSAL